MCFSGLFGKKKSTSTSTTTALPGVMQNYNYINELAKTAATKPFQKYGTQASDFVAQVNPQQTMGISGINASVNAYQPYFQNATAATQAGMGPAYEGIQNYMSPYIKNVADTTGALMKQQFEQAQSGALGTAASSGAFGGDRAGIAAANMQQQNQLGYGKTMADIYNQGYTQALGASQADLARQLQGGAQMAGLGAQSQQLGLAGGQAQIAAGSLQQQTEQAGKDALINQFMQEQGYPFQTAQFLANIYSMTGPGAGSTTTNVQPGSFWSDRRLKHDVERIGHTDDGQPIYRFKYNGSNQTQIGLMADQVEKHHPDAVGTDPKTGYKYVDYDRATQHMAKGGVAGPYQIEIGATPGAGGYMPENYVKPSEMLLPDAEWLASVNQSAADRKTGLQDLIDNIGRIKDTYNQFAGEYQPKATGGSVDEKKTLQERGYLQPILDAMAEKNNQGLVGAQMASGATPSGSGGGSGIVDTVGKIVDVAGKVKNFFGWEQGGAVGDRHGYALDGGVTDPYTEKLRREQEVRDAVAGLGLADRARSEANARAAMEQKYSNPANSMAPKVIMPNAVSGLVAQPQSANSQNEAWDQPPVRSGMMQPEQPFRSGPTQSDQPYRSGPTGLDVPVRSGMTQPEQSFRSGQTAMRETPVRSGPTGLNIPVRSGPTGLAPITSPFPQQGVAGSLASMRPQARPADLGTPAPSADGANVAADVMRTINVGPTAFNVPNAKPATLGDEIKVDTVDPVGFYNTNIIRQESGDNQFDKNGNPLTSSAGAVGVGQIMESTGPEAAKLAGLPWDRDRWLNDKDYNKTIGQAYFLDQYRKFGSLDKAAAAYNAGPGAVASAIDRATALGGSYLDYLPDETKGYVQSTTGMGGLGGANVNAGQEASVDGVKPYQDRNFLGQIFHNADAKGTLNRDAVMSLLSGVGTMLASPSQYFLPTLGAGLAAGANTYMAREGQRADITAQNLENLKKIANGTVEWNAIHGTDLTPIEYAKAANMNLDPVTQGLLENMGGGSGAASINPADINGFTMHGDIKVPNMNDYQFLQNVVQKWGSFGTDTWMGRTAATAKARLDEIKANGFTNGIGPDGKPVQYRDPIAYGELTAGSERLASAQRNELFGQAAQGFSNSAPVTAQGLDELAKIMTTTGAGAERSILSGLDAAAGIFGVTTGTYAQRTQQALSKALEPLYAQAQAGNMSPAASQELAELQSQLTNPNLEPSALRDAIATAGAILDHQRDAYQEYYFNGGMNDPEVAGDPAKFMIKYETEHPFSEAKERRLDYSVTPPLYGEPAPIEFTSAINSATGQPFSQRDWDAFPTSQKVIFLKAIQNQNAGQ